MTTTLKATFYKLASESADYTIEWSDAIGADTISTSTWTVPAGLTRLSDTFTTNTATIYLSGGSLGAVYNVINAVTTVGGLTLTQAFILVCSPTPSTYGASIFNVTMSDIVYGAFEMAGIIAAGETLSAPDFFLASKTLNMMIKAWQAREIGLWLNKTYTQTLTAGTQTYYLGPNSTPFAIARPLDVLEARLRSSDGIETPMFRLSRDEYLSLPLKSSTGKPVNWYFDAQTTNALFSIWPVASDLTDTIVMTLRTPIQDIINAGDIADFPVEWAEAIEGNLAVRLGAKFEVPLQKMALLKMIAQERLDEVQSFDREKTSTYFSPYYQPGR